MNRHVVDPPWSNPVVWYIFLAGVAAGSSAVAALATLFGGEADRRATRAAHALAVPLVAACGLLWLGWVAPPSGWPGTRPPRKARPVADTETVRLLALGAFGLVSLLGERVGRARRLVAAGGLVAALAVGASTAAVRSTGWADAHCLRGVFLASAVSTGAAAVALLGRKSDDAVERLGRADGWVIVLELGLLSALALTARGVSGLAFQRWPGMLIPLFVVPVGLVLPLLLRQARGPRGAVDAALLVLLGGFALRVAVVGIPASLPFP